MMLIIAENRGGSEGVYGDFLYFLLNCSVNIKLLKKFFFKGKKNWGDLKNVSAQIPSLEI